MALRAGERRRVALELPPEALALLGEDLRPRIEPGELRVVVGDERLAATFHVR